MSVPVDQITISLPGAASLCVFCIGSAFAVNKSLGGAVRDLGVDVRKSLNALAREVAQLRAELHGVDTRVARVETAVEYLDRAPAE